MSPNTDPTCTVNTGDATKASLDFSMLAYFIHDTSSLQDRLLIRAAAEDGQTTGYNADHTHLKESKL
ncbi:hypothetical protein F66182_2920 [Fusarium sp. NRRL 66182]|nr:hypothetical protein F66182_2920 [Fusarium sp. NRRL 66182]